MSAKRWPAAAKAPVCMVLSLDVLPAFADTIYALPGMYEPRGRLTQCSVSLHAVLAASLGAHRKAQHARVCFVRRPLRLQAAAAQRVVLLGEERKASRQELTW